MRDGEWNSDIKAVWVRLEGHGWDGKGDKDENPREGCGDGRLREEKKVQPGHRAKKSKNTRNISDFSRNRLSMISFQRKSVHFV